MRSWLPASLLQASWSRAAAQNIDLDVNTDPLRDKSKQHVASPQDHMRTHNCSGRNSGRNSNPA